jgi:hypothetical protein
MKTSKIYDDDMNGFTRIYQSDFVENVNPIEYYKNIELEISIQSIKDILYLKNPSFTSALDDDDFVKMAKKYIPSYYEEAEEIILHQNYITLFSTSKKKDQVKLLKGMCLNSMELIALIFKSYEYGYTYSKYLFEKLPASSTEKIKPIIARKDENNNILKIGNTNLSDGELKNLIEQRNAIVSHFFERDGLWHCFFVTYNSLSGKENWEGGQPHFHYISSSFEIKKDDFITSMKKGNYLSTSIHIPFQR